MSDEVEIVKAGVQATVQGLFAPYNQLILNLLGPVTEDIGLDWRDRYRSLRTARTGRLLGRVEEGFTVKQTEPHAVPPKLLATVLENGSLEEDDALQDRWAALLINAGPSGQEEQLLLNSAPEMLKQLNKWEIMLLERCMETLKPDDYMPLPVPEVRSQLNTIHEWAVDLRLNHPGFDRSGMRYSIDFGIMIQNLVRLRLLKTKEENGKEVDIFLTTLGYHFVLLCNFPRPWVPGPPQVVEMKMWIMNWPFLDESGEVRHFNFAGNLYGAKTWDLREDAESYVRKITKEGGKFISAGTEYTVKNLAVEEKEDGRFVISCVWA